MIQDSGTRREFETGAVRDIAEGKGRCDLLPLDIISDVLYHDIIIFWIGKYVETGDVDNIFRIFVTICNTDELKIFPDIFTMILEVSKHFEEGCNKYGERNWQKGIPTHCYIDSAIRHYLKFLRGDKDERHDRAFVWNLVCLLWTTTHKPEMNDLPFANKEK